MIFSALRGLIAAAPHEPNMILNAIARAAQSITRCNGAAVALRCDGVVVCRGRSGESAPALGTRLDVNSGISGECLRLGKILRCDDSRIDYRADPEVCRRLGLRSIAAIPLRGEAETIGILEVFSTQAHAFTDEHMDSLVRLGELAEAAAKGWDQEDDVSGREERSRLADSDLAISSPPHQTIAPVLERVLHLEPRQRYRLAGVTLALLFLFAAMGLRMRRYSVNGTVKSPPVATERDSKSATNIEASSATPSAVSVWKPNPGHSGNQSSRAVAPPTTQSVAKTETGNSASRSPGNRGVATTSLPTADLSTVPKIVGSATSTGDLGRLFSPPAVLPGFGPAVSEGFSGGVLVHKVQPLYPPQARLLRLAGKVVLQTTIAEDGTVSDLKVISGHPILAQAAIAAVSHWRYRPFLLNGKPIPKQVDISVEFKLPGEKG
jgi:TonB family protein